MVEGVGGDEEEALRGHGGPSCPCNYSSRRGAMTTRSSTCWSGRTSHCEIKSSHPSSPPPPSPRGHCQQLHPSNSQIPPRIHGSSLRCTQLRSRLLLPLSGHRQTGDPRPRRPRNLPFLTIHERGGLGTGEAAGEHRHRNQRRRVCCWYLLRPEVWRFDHTLEHRQGYARAAVSLALTIRLAQHNLVLAGSERPHRKRAPNPLLRVLAVPKTGRVKEKIKRIRIA